MAMEMMVSWILWFFKNPNNQMHDKHSLFSSTAIYFLSFNDIGGNLRINDQSNNLTALPPKEDFFYHTVSNIYNSKHSFGRPHYVGSSPLYSSLFEEGEGYMSSDADQINNSTTSRTFSINTPHKYTVGNLDANLKTVVVAWTNGGHHFKIKTGSTELNDYSFNNFFGCKI